MHQKIKFILINP